MEESRAHEDLVDVLRRSVALVVVDNGLRGDASDRRNDVVLGHAERLAFADEVVRERVAEDFTAGAVGGALSLVHGSCEMGRRNSRLGRVELEVLPAEEAVDHALVDLAALAHRAVAVKLLLSVGEVAHGGVNEDVPGSAVEVIALRRAALVVGRDEADVGDAANVLAGAELRRVVEEEGVKEGDKGGSLATGGWRQAKVSATLCSECTRSDSPWSLMRKSVTAVMPVLFRGSSCNQLAVSDAERAKGGSPGSKDGTLGHGKRRLDLTLLGHREEPDGLTVRGDCVDRRLVHAVLLDELVDRVGKDLAKLDVDLGELFRGRLVVEDHLHDPLLDGLGEGDLAVLQHTWVSAPQLGLATRFVKAHLEQLKVHGGRGCVLPEVAEGAVDAVLWPLGVSFLPQHTSTSSETVAHHARARVHSEDGKVERGGGGGRGGHGDLCGSRGVVVAKRKEKEVRMKVGWPARGRLNG
jgi:hypothetical protein